ncbi:MAG: hypothetical protein NZM25_11165, partial [Leptospiraceae bacterium]|nr:hypothetical protein [Leptospiraceae bacterium]
MSSFKDKVKKFFLLIKTFMLKRTLYFGNPARLSVKNEQLCIHRDNEEPLTTPLEDLGFLILDNPQLTLTQALLARLMQYNVALVSCDER